MATVETHLLFTSVSAITATHNFLDFTENADVGGGTSDASHGAGKASDDMAEREGVSSTTSRMTACEKRAMEVGRTKLLIWYIKYSLAPQWMIW